VTTLDRYRAAGLQYLVLDPGNHATPALALEAVEFFAQEVRPLLERPEQVAGGRNDA
jgi:hypothetical protein